MVAVCDTCGQKSHDGSQRTCHTVNLLGLLKKQIELDSSIPPTTKVGPASVTRVDFHSCPLPNTLLVACRSCPPAHSPNPFCFLPFVFRTFSRTSFTFASCSSSLTLLLISTMNIPQANTLAPMFVSLSLSHG